MERILKAVEIAFANGQIDGSHHKLWVIDQMLRILLGKEYETWVKQYESDGEIWDVGIPP